MKHRLNLIQVDCDAESESPTLPAENMNIMKISPEISSAGCTEYKQCDLKRGGNDEVWRVGA